MTAPLSRRWPAWCTLSNGLTATRLAAAPVFFHLVVGEVWWAACALFWLAVASDLVDGRLARARGETSVLGGLLDHGSDAAFVTLGGCALAATGRAPVWLPALIALAFLQYVLDSRSLEGRALRTSLLGRWNGILYFVPPGIVVTREALGLATPSDVVVVAIGWVLVGSTVISMADRLLALLTGARAPASRPSARE
jgi:phosphatidylglycerophosphate synthase